MLNLYNTKTRAKDYFHSLNENIVKMYVCGPTVYNHIHLGNARSVVCYDVLFRVLKYLYSNVIYVRNITDIDDKIVNTAKELSLSITQVANKYIDSFHKSCDYLHCLSPTQEPRATDFMNEIVNVIQKLILQDIAYFVNKDIYFDVSKIQTYGHLSNKNIESLFNGIRVETNANKRNKEDFVLWKSIEDDFGIDTSLGYGRPGWHTECVAMSTVLLGEHFDIHGGGVDLVFPHHENEVAQASGCKYKFANYWIHNGFLMVDGKKMSKSLGNFVTVQDLTSKYHGGAIRMALLSGHYAKPLNFTYKLLDECQKLFEKIHPFESIDTQNLKPNVEILCDNINTPKFFANIHGNIKTNLSQAICDLKFIGVLL